MTGRTAAGAEVTSRPLVVAVCGVEFGWGSAGKLDTVMGAIAIHSPRPVRFVGLGSRLGRPILAGGPVNVWYDADPADTGGLADLVRRERVDVALSVLDAPRAKALQALGIPTVFLDSLPFLWTEGDLSWAPLEVAAYCAQRSPRLPESRAVLDRIRHLHWVGAVVPRQGPASGRKRSEGVAGSGVPARVVVNLGGLIAPGLEDREAFPRLVVPPVLWSLFDLGVRMIRVRGNIPDDLAVRLLADGPDGLDIRIGQATRRAFLTELADCDLLLTSPGLTTLLEASVLDTPVVCLPPQNVSQILNASFHERATGGPVVRRPAEVVDESEIVSARAGGEDAALRLIYAAIRTAATNPSGPSRVRDLLRSRITEAVRTSSRGDFRWSALANSVGLDGASEVAEHVHRLAARRSADGVGEEEVC